jgi:redox-sensitive bicupin YhaK (pirin superfamily)
MKNSLHRRRFLMRSLLAAGSALALPVTGFTRAVRHTLAPPKEKHPVIRIKPMGFQWETTDPFLFCVHHEDHFPRGNTHMGPDPAHFKGRIMGEDFIIKDGFRMYHGKKVPGFPGHPHRGFETITVVREGIVDHSDSLGAAGRYGNGDVQWMTAGKGIQHAEMFPLIHTDRDNPMELFQIWLNLPRKNKMVDPHFKMLWRETVPTFVHKDVQLRETRVEIFAGHIGNKTAPAPPPNSWAADPTNEVAVWNIKMEPNATWVLPKASEGINRTIYFYQGRNLDISGLSLDAYQCAELHAHLPTRITAGDTPTGILMLQGRPIAEPVIQYGPFVMNTKQEINQAFEDFHKDQFGGWPWPAYDHVHPRDRPRFARHADGREEVMKG